MHMGRDMTVQIKTNRNWRPFVYRADVPAAVLADQFSHLDEEDSLEGFFQYKGWWYHLSDFMRLEVGLAVVLPGWDGYSSDSYFSGVVIKVSKDGDRYRVGTYST
jgi:hypothetical protein